MAWLCVEATSTEDLRRVERIHPRTVWGSDAAWARTSRGGRAVDVLALLGRQQRRTRRQVLAQAVGLGASSAAPRIARPPGGRRGLIAGVSGDSGGPAARMLAPELLRATAGTDLRPAPEQARPLQVDGGVQQGEEHDRGV